MLLGIGSPVVTRHPATAAQWEADAGIAELAAIAEAADRLGLHHMTCSEHVAVPADVAAERGGTYWDPLATFGYLAARTSRLRLVTQVLVLGFHHPLEIAKRYGTLDTVSGGRLVLGLGVGSLREEFDLLGEPFSGRGARADEAIVALRAAMGTTSPTHSGEHYAFADVVVDPTTAQAQVPLWIGGRSARSLRRAVELGDGWVPFGLPLRELSAMLGAADLPEDFSVVLSPGRPLDPLGDRDRTAHALERVREAGATITAPYIAAQSAAHYIDQLAALREIGVEAGAAPAEQR